ncbi:MAG TPA: hypothetical protein VI540_09050 [Gaiellaceae bacterium]|nr:hypothetical protein [Gaiellaceae bacterium]
MELLLLLAVLVCPLVMGGMTVWMMRRTRGGARGEPPQEDAPR